MPRAVSSNPLPALTSIFTSLPSERGGPENRRGLAFQDHIAAGFMLEMFERDDLKEVWCEAEDDITLIWDSGAGVKEVEFVQVKSDNPDQFWTVALLYKRKKGTNGRAIRGSSILERSLGRDTFTEPCRFRIVTAVPVSRDLRHLLLRVGHRLREPGTRGYIRFEALFPPRLRVFRSPKGNDWTFWVARTLWEVRHSIEAVRDHNLLRLNAIVRDFGLPLAPDQLEQVYDLLVRNAFDVGMVDGEVNPEAKRVTREQCREMLIAAATRARNAGAPADEHRLEEKLTAAGVADAIQYARDARLRFLRERRSARYFTTEQRERFDDEVEDRLHGLWADYQAGEIPDSPAQFYRRCVKEMDYLRPLFDAEDPMPSVVPRGAMFDRVNRCVHRFVVRAL